MSTPRLDETYFEFLTEKAIPRTDDVAQAWRCKYPEATVVLLPKLAPSRPICAVTILLPAIIGSDARSIFTKRSGAPGKFQVLFSASGIPFEIVLTNLTAYEGSSSVKVDVLGEDAKVVEPLPDNRINEVNVIRPSQSYVVEADRREGNRRLVVEGIEKKGGGALSVGEDDASSKPLSKHFFVNVVGPTSCPEIASLLDGGTSWKPMEQFVRVVEAWKTLGAPGTTLGSQPVPTGPPRSTPFSFGNPIRPMLLQPTRSPIDPSVPEGVFSQCLPSLDVISSAFPPSSSFSSSASSRPFESFEGFVGGGLGGGEQRSSGASPVLVPSRVKSTDEAGYGGGGREEQGLGGSDFSKFTAMGETPSWRETSFSATKEIHAPGIAFKEASSSGLGGGLGGASFGGFGGGGLGGRFGGGPKPIGGEELGMPIPQADEDDSSEDDSRALWYSQASAVVREDESESDDDMGFGLFDGGESPPRQKKRVDVTSEEVSASQAGRLAHGALVKVDSARVSTAFDYGLPGERMEFGLSVFPDMGEFDALPREASAFFGREDVAKVLETYNDEIGAQLRRVFKEDECVVCCEAAPSKVALRCGHQCVCGPCFEHKSYKKNRCPMCRGVVLGYADSFD